MPQKLPVPWKRNLRKIPDVIRAKVESLGDAAMIAATVKRIPQADIVAGKYRHLQIVETDGEGRHPTRIVPDPRIGRYSRRNVEGREIVHRDRPKVSRTFCWEVPNFPPSLDTHEICQTREVYERDFIPPEQLSLSIERILTEEVGGETIHTFTFAVDTVLERGQRDFDDELLIALNLLQENVGSADIFPSDATREAYLRTVRVHWEFLPPGERDATVQRLVTRLRATRPEQQAKIASRYDTLMAMHPAGLLVGVNDFARYFGAQFGEHLARIMHMGR